MDSPFERPGRSVEVEGELLEEEERSMKGWCHVRRRSGQEEKDVATVLRGWEEYKQKFPHMAHFLRQRWSSMERDWFEGRAGSEEKLERLERRMRERAGAKTREVEEWLSGGGEM